VSAGGWRVEAIGLSLIVVGYLALALLYGLVTPIYEGPDEIGHVMVVRHLSIGRGLPVQSPENAFKFGFAQEGSQAPLYYALSAALVKGLGLSLEDLDGPVPVNPFTTCGEPGLNNVSRYQHDPRRETFPYQGTARAVHVMRAFSALLGAATVVVAYTVSRLAFPRLEGAALLAATLVATNAQAAFMGGVVNNDNLVNLLTGCSLALTLYGLRRGFAWWLALALGLVAGLTVLAKLGGLMALVFVGMGLTAGLWRRPSRLMAYGALTLGTFMAVSGWWFVRNWALYGDPTGTRMMLSVVGAREAWPLEEVIADVGHTLRSYWGVFACEADFPRQAYWVFALIPGLAVVGWGRAWRTISDDERWRAGLLLIWLGLVTLSWLRWNQLTYAPLGRLFFQAFGAIAPLLAYGLARLTRKPCWLAAGMGMLLGALSLAGAQLIVQPAFQLPVVHAATEAPDPPSTLPQASFGDAIEVLGYDVVPRSVGPGEVVEVKLFLRAARPISVDYALALQLLSPIAGDTTTLVNFNTIPGHGGLPTVSWSPQEIIEDTYRLRIPRHVVRAQAWRIGAIFYRPADGTRLPVTVDGQSAGPVLGLGLVRVGASGAIHVPSEALLEVPTVFGDAIELRGVHLTREDGRLVVRTWWQATAAPGVDYTALVHLYDDTSALLATADAPPLRGGFPTSLWEEGDFVEEEYIFASDERAWLVGLGWYDPATGTRLSVGGPWSSNLVMLPIP
jgi:hypothetical protein